MQSRPPPGAQPGRATQLIFWAIVTSGIAIRLAVYLHNKSLWLDESMLAVNVLDGWYRAC